MDHMESWYLIEAFSQHKEERVEKLCELTQVVPVANFRNLWSQGLVKISATCRYT